MRFGLQHPNFSFDYDGQDTSQIIDSLKNLIMKAENSGFDSFWVIDHFHQIPMIGKPEEPMLESWTTISVPSAFLTGKFPVITEDSQIQSLDSNMQSNGMQTTVNGQFEPFTKI